MASVITELERIAHGPPHNFAKATIRTYSTWAREFYRFTKRPLSQRGLLRHLRSCVNPPTMPQGRPGNAVIRRAGLLGGRTGSPWDKYVATGLHLPPPTATRAGASIVLADSMRLTELAGIRTTLLDIFT